jgi:hypothetical protein
LFWSAIKKPPSAVAATPSGPSSWALVAGPPSPENPCVLPATVVIVPSGDTRRTRWLNVSAIKKPPSAVAATPNGVPSWAAVDKPPSPENPNVEPATVKTLLVAAPAAGAANADDTSPSASTTTTRARNAEPRPRHERSNIEPSVSCGTANSARATPIPAHAEAHQRPYPRARRVRTAAVATRRNGQSHFGE